MWFLRLSRQDECSRRSIIGIPGPNPWVRHGTSLSLHFTHQYNKVMEPENLESLWFLKGFLRFLSFVFLGSWLHPWKFFPVIRCPCYEDHKVFYSEYTCTDFHITILNLLSSLSVHPSANTSGPSVTALALAAKCGTVTFWRANGMVHIMAK